MNHDALLGKNDTEASLNRCNKNCTNYDVDHWFDPNPDDERITYALDGRSDFAERAIEFWMMRFPNLQICNKWIWRPPNFSPAKRLPLPTETPLL